MEATVWSGDVRSDVLVGITFRGVRHLGLM